MSYYNKDRDNATLGKFYTDHVSAMTREGLHKKSDIASELAVRDARIAEMERDNERFDAQWREELRIYRETENARIAELEAALRRVRRWCMGGSYSASVQVAMQKWIDGGMVGVMPALTGLESAIEARAGNGGGV